MIKAIIFDLGGVLIDLDIDRCKRAFIEIAGYDDIGLLLDASHQKGIYSDLEEGKVSPDDFRRKIIEGSSKKGQVTPEDVDRSMWALLTGIAPYKVDLLRELSQKYDLYLLSNNNAISMVRCREIFREAGLPMEKVFRKLFLSYEMKMLKPSAAIYRTVVAKISLPASELLFVDDSISNIEAAESEGINTLRYRQGDDLRASLFKRLDEIADAEGR